MLGPRAFPRLARFIESPGPTSARALALSALDGLEDPHAIDVAFAVLNSHDIETVIAALSVLRTWVPRETGTRLLEAITAIAVDRERDARVRVAALDALSDLPDELLRPIREQAPPPEAGGPPLDNPVAARDWMDAHGARATLAMLHDAIKSFRDAEGAAETSGEKSEWLRARGVAHAMLAMRGSRLALYDARETFSTAKAPLPPGFVETIANLGDASCLEPLARAWSATRDSAWRAQLSEAARRIVTRARIGGRNSVMKDIRANWSGFI